MLRADPAGVRAGRRPFCLVTNDLDYVLRNGGIGTYCWLLAHLLARGGYEVHILYCGRSTPPPDLRDARRRLDAASVTLHWLGDFEVPEDYRVPSIDRCWQLDDSERVRVALEQLHQRFRFGLVEFPEWGALGFRAVQARRSRSAFEDLPMLVTLHSSSQWMREGNCQWMGEANDLQVDYCERYAFDHADHQAAPSRYMLDYARKVGWAVRPDARVIPYPLPGAEFPPAPEPAAGMPELVFFGRLETRKGLEVFVEVAGRLPPEVPVTFLGRENDLCTGEPATEFVRRRLADRPFTLLTDLNREQALGYLTGGQRLAVLPALLDNYPFAVIECAAHGIPFVASAVGGVPEILPDPELRGHLFFEPTPRGLEGRLRTYLAATPEERAAWRDRAQAMLDREARDAEVLAHYERLMERPKGNPSPQPPPRSGEGEQVKTPGTIRTASLLSFHPLSASGRGLGGGVLAAPAQDSPLVTVVVPHYNLPRYLPAALESLAAQTWPSLEVLIIDDGSTDPQAVRVFEEQRARYPQFRFLRQDNAGIGATRNRGLREANGEYLVCMDADNVARPEMVERLVRGIHHRPDCAALSCFFLAFRDGAAPDQPGHPYAYRPAGGPHVMAAFRNVYGDANAIFRVADFRAIGGFETDRDTSFEDWEAFVKLTRHGKGVDVLPEHLFYYRHREEGFSRATNNYRNRQRVLRQFLFDQDLPPAERAALWSALASFQRETEHLNRCLTSYRYRLADRVHGWLCRVPFVFRLARGLLRDGGRLRRSFRESLPSTPRQQAAAPCQPTSP